MTGAFGLTSPKDLLDKLGRQLASLKQSPNDRDLAFDFFVTAESMLDWLHPGYAGKAARENARNDEVLLQTVSHIASGAKHYDSLAPHHQSVERSGEEGGFFASAYFGSRYFASG